MLSISGNTGIADEAQEQIAFADVILINKIDLVTPEQLDELEKRIRGMNAMAKIYRTRNSELEMDALLGVKPLTCNRALEIDPQFLSEDAHEHDETVYSVALVESGELDGEKLNDWIAAVANSRTRYLPHEGHSQSCKGEDHRFVFPRRSYAV
jgi:G3E family GTPase